MLQGVLAVANGPRGMAPHLVLQTPGMPSPYMQVRPDCPHSGRCMVMGFSEASQLEGCNYACKLWHLTRRLLGWCQSEGAQAAMPHMCGIIRGASIACFFPSKVLKGLSPGAVQMRPPVAQQQLRPQAQQGMPAHRPATQQPALLQSAHAVPVS